MVVCIQVADTGSFMTAVPRGIIPVPRHWDPGNLIASNALGLVSMGFAL